MGNKSCDKNVLSNSFQGLFYLNILKLTLFEIPGSMTTDADALTINSGRYPIVTVQNLL